MGRLLRCLRWVRQELQAINAIKCSMQMAILRQITGLRVSQEYGFYRNGLASDALFGTFIHAMLCLRDNRILVADEMNHCIRVISSDLSQVETLAGPSFRLNGYQNVMDPEEGLKNVRFNRPSGLALLNDDRVLVADTENNRIRVIDQDFTQIEDVAGDATFNRPTLLLRLHDRSILVAETNLIRRISADLQTVSTLDMHFSRVSGLVQLPDRRVLVADDGEKVIYEIPPDLTQKTVLAGQANIIGHKDGLVRQARFNGPSCMCVLPSEKVLIVDTSNENVWIRIICNNYTEVKTVKLTDDQKQDVSLDRCSGSILLLPDGRVLINGYQRIDEDPLTRGIAYDESYFASKMYTLQSPAAKVISKPAAKVPNRFRDSSASSAGKVVDSALHVRKRFRASSASASSSSDSEDDSSSKSRADSANVDDDVPLVLFPGLGRLKF